MSQQTIRIPKQLKQDLQKLGDAVARNVAKIAADNLTAQCQVVINDFYKAYNPKYYRRTYSFEDYSYRRLYQPMNGHGHTYIGGVMFNSEWMGEPYEQPAETVLWYALQGWHGYPADYNYQSDSPLQALVDYQQKMIASIHLIGQEAIAQAKQQVPLRSVY